MLKKLILAAALLAASPAAALDINAFSQALNAQRVANGLQPVQYNPRLSAAAEHHARDLIANNFISHTGSNGSSPGDRVRSVGYCWRNVVENIAWRIPGEANVVYQWMGSSSHRRNILNTSAREFGVARVGDNYWVLVMARGC